MFIWKSSARDFDRWARMVVFDLTPEWPKWLTRSCPKLINHADYFAAIFYIKDFFQRTLEEVWWSEPWQQLSIECFVISWFILKLCLKISSVQTKRVKVKPPAWMEFAFTHGAHSNMVWPGLGVQPNMTIELDMGNSRQRQLPYYRD